MQELEPQENIIVGFEEYITAKTPPHNSINYFSCTAGQKKFILLPSRSRKYPT